MAYFWCHSIATKSSFLATTKLSGLALYFLRNPQKHKKRFETSNDLWKPHTCSSCRGQNIPNHQPRPRVKAKVKAKAKAKAEAKARVKAKDKVKAKAKAKTKANAKG
uniref:Uncharacterized protein n=1 Tax=Acrobeloides nanus TaxID=290746 RepID=A0A914DSR4_9BILA